MARTIPICSLALLFIPTIAQAQRPGASALRQYVSGRLADQNNQSILALRHYAAALAAAPSNAEIASRTYYKAVESGDFAVATRAAKAMDRGSNMPPDAHILLYISALRARDRDSAFDRLRELANQRGLGFLAPIFSRWLEGAQTPSTPVSVPITVGVTANVYTAENEALIALAKGEIEDAVVAIKSLWAIEPYRAGSLRLAAASRLMDDKRGARALDLVIAEDRTAIAARSMIHKGLPLGISVNSPPDGAAFILARVAGDLITEGSGRSALTMARLAEFAAPHNARIKLLVAGALAARKRHQEALATATTVVGDALYGSDAASFRIDQLAALGQFDAALAETRQRAGQSPNDQARIGDIESRRGNYAAAAAAYQQALDAAGPQAGWPLVFATANAYHTAGNWSAAEPLLERALLLAPTEPALLNKLGYGLIIHNDNLDRGMQLITTAVQLRPDNPAIIDSLGWAYFRRGDFTQAIALLERAVRFDHNQPEIGEHLGDAYWAAGRRIDARYAWTAARVGAAESAHARIDAKIAGKR